MRLSLNWLQDFVEVSVPAPVLAEKLTLAGLEVEVLEEINPGFTGVVVGKVTRVERHPRADRLQMAVVEDGRRTYRVACGAPNLEAGRLYPFAPPGAEIFGDRRIEAVKLRGVVSEGMLLAEDELGLSADHVGLMEIPQDLPLGQDLAVALQLADVVLEVAVTPNRPDCLSMLGLAREVAALLRQPLRHPEVEVAPGAAAGPQARVTILAPVHCPRYAARLVVDLAVRPSPFWLRRRLSLCGLRAINNLVDITNYVLLEFGQPLHAFDFDRLQGGEIVVRLPGKEEVGGTFTTLDGQARVLDPETLLICDAVRPVALAGIMGGLESEVTEATHRVLIESAYFNPRTIRRTAKRLGLSTEASYRFERGVDPDGVTHALERATQLMVAVGGGRAPAERIDVYPQPLPRPRLPLRVPRANAVLGTAFSREQVAEVLRSLHLPAVQEDADTLAVQVPSFRGDLEREVDLIEEVARVAGYDRIPVTLPRGVVACRRPAPQVRRRLEAKQLLLGLGFFEVISYAFQSERLRTLLAGGEGPALALANPLSEETAVMRTSLLPGLLETLRRNALKQLLDVRLFELSKVFLPLSGADLPREEQWLAAVMYGSREEASWLAGKEKVDFLDLKGAVETLLAGLKVHEPRFEKKGLPPYLRVGARVYSGDQDLGVLGELAPEIVEKLDLEGSVFLFDLNFDVLIRVAESFPLYTPLPRYPAVYLDVALVLPCTVPAAQVAQALHRHGRPWLEEARLFDVYAGPPIPPEKRSLAFRLAYRDPERTLTDDLVHAHHQQVLAALKEELGAELR